MSTPPIARRERRPPRKRRGWARPLLWLAAIVVVFGVGLALGEALHDNPSGGTQTVVRTLKPLPLPPARETVTVTRPG
ncbi:MAG TPA: hypothetical protein VH760_07630 [Gaiellaceae bacterium]